MTINVIVATYHAVVLGCDSLSSVVERAIFPYRQTTSIALDAAGEPLLDSDGFFTIPVRPDQMQPVATNVTGGVKKMFLLHEDPDQANLQSSVAAMTSGMAILTGVTIAGHADRFRRQVCRPDCNSTQEVIDQFVAYLRPLWEQEVDFQNARDDAKPNLSDVNLLVAGYGPADDYIKVYRISIRDQTCREEFSQPPHCSACWAGTSSSVAKLINGIDANSRYQVTRSVVETLAAQRQSVVESVLGALAARGVEVPEDFELEVEEQVPPTLPWDSGIAPIDWANLPTQYAVDLVSTLVNAESGIQRFSSGIPVVGGRTRIGLLRRGEPFEMVNEPAVIHTHLGYSSDA